MNHLKPLTQLLILVFSMSSCTKPELNRTPKIDNSNNAIAIPDNKSQFKFKKDAVRSRNELIIEFNNDLNDNFKNKLRKQFKVLEYTKCNCTNKRIELWQFDNGVDIEGRKDEITQDGIGVEGTDFQYYFKTSSDSSQNTNHSQDADLIKAFTSEQSPKVTIAILDTGINLKALPDSSPFLYNSSNSKPCDGNQSKEISGWDFVNNDNDTYDDNGHGTIVTQIIKSRLGHENAPNYQILPVKIFNNEGRGSTFTTLCGYLYASDKDAVSIINFSFGWYGAPSNLLEKYISENPMVLHLSSAGNNGSDNDRIQHYPSSYNLKNILAIGSVGSKLTQISNFSNYGRSSVDFLSLGEAILFQDSAGDSHYVSGTSFATPLVTALSAKYYTDGFQSPYRIKLQLLANATVLPPKNQLPVKFHDRVIE